MLGVDGESIFTTIKAAHLLFVAKTILLDLNDVFQNYPVCFFWFQLSRSSCFSIFYFNFEAFRLVVIAFDILVSTVDGREIGHFDFFFDQIFE
jgi:hypothetical protein